MRRAPSRRPGTVRNRKPEAGVVLVVYEPVYPHEVGEIEKNVRACFGDWCGQHEWQHWTYEPEKQTLSAAVEVACDDPDQITTSLMYHAWDAIEHFTKVLIYLDALVWEEPFHRGDEVDYQEYIEETRLPAEQEEAEDLARDGRASEGRAFLIDYVKRAEEQCRLGAPWSAQLLKYYRDALEAFEKRHGLHAA